jgi:hypothetical protein
MHRLDSKPFFFGGLDRNLDKIWAWSIHYGRFFNENLDGAAFVQI